ncbi:MAG: MFS transporter [Desulfobacterales bacterium]
MRKIFYGWWVVAATSLVGLWAAGTFFYSFTAFFNPIVREFGWSYTATSIAAALRSIEGGLASPIVGFAADRFGSRRLLIAGGILSGAGFILFSRIDTLWEFYFIFIFISIGVSLLMPIPGWTVTANWFVKKRSIALGILTSSTGVGGILIYGINLLIDTYGWRSALVAIGLGFWVIVIPCACLVRQRPDEMNLLPDGDPPNRSTPIAPHRSAVSVEGFTLSEVLKTKAFWTLTLISTVSAGAYHGALVHIMPHFLSIELDRKTSSLIASLLIVVGIFGRFGFGWLNGRIEGRKLLAFGLVLQAFGSLLLIWADSFWEAMLVVATFGPGSGGLITLRVVLQADYFGLKAFGSVQGLIMALMVVGFMAGPVLTGLAYDVFHSYSHAWQIMAILLAVMIPVALTLKSPERPVAKKPSPDSAR